MKLYLINNKTALHQAFEQENPDVINLFLKHEGVNLKIKDNIYISFFIKFHFKFYGYFL